jgi:hypothetical protein
LALKGGGLAYTGPVDFGKIFLPTGGVVMDFIKAGNMVK